MVVERAARDEGFVHCRAVRPIHAVRQRLMFVEALYDLTFSKASFIPQDLKGNLNKPSFEELYALP